MATGSYHQQRATMHEAPPGCPVNHEWSPLDDDYLADPYPTARRFGAECPVMFAERLGYVVVNRMEDIVAVFNDPETFASVNVQDPVFPLLSLIHI